MKISLLFIVSAVCMFIAPVATLLADSDNTPAGAVELLPNSSSAGSLTDVTDEVDYWRITTTFDGSLVVNTTSDPSLDLDLAIYDQDGTTQIASYDISSGIYEATHRYDLAQGTYYIKAYKWSGSGGYSISNTFVPTGQPNDSEPNDSYAIAEVLLLNNSSTGHLAYYGNLHTDAVDWWKVTTTFDGGLVVNTTSESTLDLDLQLFDKDGITQIAGSDTSSGIHEATHKYDLAPGTYYIKAYKWQGYGSYTISNVFTPTGRPNDPEPNDTMEISSTLAINGSSTGHLGYCDLGNCDMNDWWKITVPLDGNLVVRTYSDATLNVDLFMYDSNGKTQIAAYDTSTGRNEATHYYGLKAGNYYVRAYRWQGYGSYDISSEFTAAHFASDAEVNDSLQTAASIALHTVYYGHIGFFGAGSIDMNDYYSFSLPGTWDSLFIRTDSDPTADIDLRLYNQSGILIASSGYSGPTEIMYYVSASPGIYFVDVYRWSGYGSYGMIVTNTRPNGQLVDVKEEKQERSLPVNFRLTQNYPNPFNPGTTFQYDVPVASRIVIKVYNILGREVTTLVNDFRPAGTHTVVWDASNLPSGVYFYQMRAGKFTDVRKAVLMK